MVLGTIGHASAQLPVLFAALATCVVAGIFVLVLLLTNQPREKAPAVPSAPTPNCAPFDCSIGGPHR